METIETAHLGREFRLAAACCMQPPVRADEEMRALAGAGVNWPLFRRIVARHRIDGFVNEALKRTAIPLPPDVAASLADAGRDIARMNLIFAAEASRLHGLFTRAGIVHLFVKGTTLSMLAYGSLASKHARDIDLLVAPCDVEASCALLAAAGYRTLYPSESLGEAGLQAWMAVFKESTWQNEAGTLVELHHALMDNPELLEGVSIASPARHVEVAPGVRLPTLSKDELFAYLCVHGTGHGWSRLKWLADIAALTKDDSPAELVRLHDRAVQLGAGRCPGTALLLCALLLERPLPAAFEARLRCDGATLSLVRTALDLMTAGGAVVELDRFVLGTVPLHLSHFLLKPGLRYKLAELRQKLRRPDDRAALQLPRWLHFLYPVLLVPRWLGFRRGLAAQAARSGPEL